MITDLCTALKTLRTRPAFAAGAVAPLALGVAATTAIFSVVNVVLLQPLPYADGDRLVYVWEGLRNRNVEDFPWSPGDFADLRQDVGTFEDVAALVTGRQLVVVGDAGEATLVSTAAATPNVFRLLGARVVIGRDFADDDGVPVSLLPTPRARPTPPPRTIISHEFWQRRFGASTGILNRTVRLGDQPFEIIGVLEAGFELLFPIGTNVERAPEVWTPLRIDFSVGSRTEGFLRVIGRLKPGLSLAEAQTHVDRLAVDLGARSPTNAAAGLRLRVGPMSEDLVADVRAPILGLMGAVLPVLLVACANAGHVFGIGVAARERELAVRAALGGTRVRLFRQLLTEGAMLAGLAVIAAIGLTWAGIGVLLAFGPAQVPRFDHAAMDPTVAAFAALTGLASCILFAMVPAVRASRPDAMAVLRQASLTRGGPTCGWLRKAVLAAEVALGFVLLVGSGLMARNFVALRHAPLGYDRDNVLTFLTPNLGALPQPARQAFMSNLQENLSALPGVVAVAAASPLPLDGRSVLARWGTEEAVADPSKYGQAIGYLVTPGYFAAMRTPVIEGRAFIDADNAPDARVVVIDRVLASRAFPGATAVGRTLLVRLRTQEAERFAVVGVVDHQRPGSLSADGREGLYLPDGYGGYGAANRWVVRTEGDPAALASRIRRTVTAVHPRVGVVEVQPMAAFVTRAQAQTTFVLILLGILAAMGVGLASTGLYSLLSTTVRLRATEIGVRMACGASPVRILRMILGDGLRVAASGIGVGILAARALTGTFGAAPMPGDSTDLVVLAAAAAGLLAIVVVACGVPAMRAARLEPMIAVRQD